MGDENIEVQIDDATANFLGDEPQDTSKTKVSFQIDTDGNPNIPDDDVEVVIADEEPEPTPEPEEIIEPEPTPEPEVKVDEKDKKRKSRAKDRIKQLSKRNSELTRAMETQQKELAQLKSEYYDTTSTYAKMELERLTADVALLEVNLSRAVEDGDEAKITKITEQLVDSQMSLQRLQKVVESPQPSPEQVQQPQAPAEVETVSYTHLTLPTTPYV